LALARFQPDSLPGLEVSRPVMTEFMQVAPDRSAAATHDPYDPYDPGTIRLVVAGQTYRATLDEAGRTRSDGTFVQVSVEERRDDVRNELGWRPAQASQASITADAVHSADTVLWQGDHASGQPGAGPVPHRDQGTRVLAGRRRGFPGGMPASP
jgi:hypothetical protein